MQFPNMFYVDVDKGPATQPLHPLFLGDALANRIGVYLYKDGEPFSPGGSAFGRAVLSGGETVLIQNGVVSENEIYIDLPSGVYSEQGPVKITVSWTDGTTTTTVLEGTGNIRLTETGTIIDPGTIISDVTALIQAIETARASIPPTYTGLIETIALEFSSTDNYTAGQYVWYDGVLYKFTEDHDAGAWTGADASSVVIGSDLVGIRNALTSVENINVIQSEQIGTLSGQIGIVQSDICSAVFSDARPYKAGELVMYAGVLHQFTADHATGAWTGTDAVPVSVADVLTQVDEALESKAEIDGSYEGLTAGSAEQLLATTGAADRTPYTLRQTGGGVSVGDRAEETIVGGTIAWNQLVDSGTTSVTLTSGRKYISYIGGSWACGASDGTALTVTGGTDMVFDITQMFAGTVANAVYDLEQATAGAGVAWFRAMFPESYYPYNAGELMSVQTSGKRVTAVNLWDEKWEIGYYSNGEPKPSSQSTSWRSKPTHPIVITGGTTYYLNIASPLPSTANLYVYVYDKHDTFITRGGPYHGDSELDFIVSLANAKYLRFAITYASGPVSYSGGISITTRAEPCVYPLDSSLILRGVPRWDSVKGAMYYDGDEYTSDGRVKWRYGIVNLGTLTWTLNYTSYLSATVSGRKKGLRNFVLSKGTVANTYTGNFDTTFPNGTWGGSAGSSNITYKMLENEYPDAAAFKAAMSGVYLVYEMATPATDSATPYTGTQWVEAGGTEAFIDAGTETGRVAVPVGHDTFYPTDLRSKIERLPSDFSTLIAPTEATYTATRNYAVNALLIVDNTLYQVTSAIATGGTITPGTNVQATTLSELIAALQQ